MIAAVALAVALLSVAAIAAVAVTVIHRVARLRARHAMWAITERISSDKKSLEVWIIDPHTPEYGSLKGSVPLDDPDFNDKIEEVRSSTQYLLVALNSSRKRLD